jgi:hypothetical protein
MSTNVVNQMPYLRTSRSFPEESHMLTVEISKSYIDIATAVNTRTIGIFPVTRPAITGESWFLLNNQRQQSFRQVYTFTTTADIPVGFKISTISEFSKFQGLFLSGTSWFGLIPATTVAIAGQITFYVAVDGTSTTTDLIKFVVGAGAPALNSGKIVLEWLSRP